MDSASMLSTQPTPATIMEFFIAVHKLAWVNIFLYACPLKPTGNMVTSPLSTACSLLNEIETTLNSGKRKNITSISISITLNTLNIFSPLERFMKYLFFTLAISHRLHKGNIRHALAYLVCYYNKHKAYNGVEHANRSCIAVVAAFHTCFV